MTLSLSLSLSLLRMCCFSNKDNAAVESIGSKRSYALMVHAE